MTCSCAVLGSFHVLRLNNKVNSCPKVHNIGFVWGNGTLPISREKESPRKLFKSVEKINTVSIFSIFAKMTMYNSSGNTDFYAGSNFDSFANFGPLMTNNGALELSHLGEIVFDHLAGGRDKCKQ